MKQEILYGTPEQIGKGLFQFVQEHSFPELGGNFVRFGYENERELFRRIQNRIDGKYSRPHEDSFLKRLKKITEREEKLERIRMQRPEIYEYIMNLRTTANNLIKETDV